MGIVLPALPSSAAMARGGVDEIIRRNHRNEARAINDQIRPRNREQGQRILASKLRRSRGHQDRRISVVTTSANRLVEVGVRVSDMVRLIDDHEVEPGRGIKGQQSRSVQRTPQRLNHNYLISLY